MTLSKMVVFAYKIWDTNYEDLLVGLHKAIILRGLVKNGRKKILYNEDSFKREDMIPQDSPSIIFIEEGYEAEDICAALLVLGIK